MSLSSNNSNTYHNDIYGNDISLEPQSPIQQEKAETTSMDDVFKYLEEDNFDVDKFNEEYDKLARKSVGDTKEMRIETLKKIIPELIYYNQKRSAKRFRYAFVVVFVLIFIVIHTLPITSNTFLGTLLSSLILSLLFIAISYGISSFTFLKNAHELMIIEKLKTEYYTLSNQREPNIDMLLEIDKIRRNNII